MESSQVLSFKGRQAEVSADLRCARRTACGHWARALLNGYKYGPFME